MDNQFWSQRSPGLQGVDDKYDDFGWALTVGDFNGDNRDDLAVGIRGQGFKEAGKNIDTGGAVSVLYGTKSGLSTTGNQLWDQNSPGIKDEVELYDQFGYTLTAGDFNGDSRDDLVVGVPHEDIEDPKTIKDAGAVNVLYGSKSGLSSEGNQFWNQGSPGILGEAEEFDYFGIALEAKSKSVGASTTSKSKPLTKASNSDTTETKQLPQASNNHKN